MIVYKEESYNIVGAAFEVYNTLGYGFLEAVYQECLALEFQERNIPYEREKELSIYYNGHKLNQKYKADFICYGKIIIELKAVSSITEAHQAQVFNYLRATTMNLGILLNFGCCDGLEKKRLLLSDFK